MGVGRPKRPKESNQEEETLSGGITGKYQNQNPPNEFSKTIKNSLCQVYQPKPTIRRLQRKSPFTDRNIWERFGVNGGGGGGSGVSGGGRGVSDGGRGDTGGGKPPWCNDYGGGGGEQCGEGERREHRDWRKIQNNEKKDERGHFPQSFQSGPQEDDNLSTLKIIYLNSRSLLNKINDLCILINDCAPDLILVSETWFNPDISNAMLNIPGYFIEPDLRLDRTDTMNGIGGGLIVYAKNDMIIKPIRVDNNFNMFTRFEIISKDSNDDNRVRKESKQNLIVTLLYRPPRVNNENTEELCKLFENVGENSIFLGDFNFPNINWINQTSDRSSDQFLQCTINKNYEQLIDFPTHVRGNVLDLVFTNRPEDILNVESLGNLSTSDHSIISVDVLFRCKFNNSTEYINNWKDGDNEGLRNFLSEINWEAELHGRDTEEAWNFIKCIINGGIDIFIPKTIRRRSNNHQWMTKTVKSLVRRKQRHYNLFMENRTQHHFEQFKATEKTCKKTIRAAKRRFELKIARSGNKRPFNSYIKSKTSLRSNIGPLKVNDELFSDNQEMATILNETFSKVFTCEDLMNIPVCHPTADHMNVNDVYFDVSSVGDKIKKLKFSSSSGPDLISSQFLRNHVDILSLPLSILYNKSIQSGCVPLDWKVANVTPIFKKGSKNKPENYRPISLTSIPCKIMESILKDKITSHLICHNLIKNTQHGFMSNKSCTTNLLAFLEVVTKAFDEGTPMDLIYLDFSKAFDKVPHYRLLAKMKGLGITGNILKWTESWLFNRKQRVVLNGSSSDWVDVHSGVPQGSVLGPLLFVIFINDLDDSTKLITVMAKFADDTKLGNHADSAENCRQLQNCLDNLLIWAETWCMDFNTSKCKVMHIGRSNNKHAYFMNGLQLLSSDKERDIGVIINHNLKPTMQCHEAARRAATVLSQISRVFLYRDKKVFLQLYKQFVRCHLEFAVPAWSPWLLGDIEILERVQKRAINMITGLQGKNYEEKLQELQLQTLVQRRKMFDMVQTFKIIHGYDNVDASTWFTLVGDNVDRHTRNLSYNKNLIAARSKTDTRLNFFTNRVVKLWNSLPTEIKESNSINLFKSRLDKFKL